jgi:AcrR family transcriptional regulator
VGCCATPCPAILPAQRAARAHLLWSLTSGAAGWIDRYETDDYPKVAQTLADIVLNGIAGPKSAWQTECDVTALLPALAQPETTQQAFLRAATELLNEQGYRGASADRISARLNLTKGAFYHHNENKDDLISACFDRMSTVIRNTQTLVDDLPGTGWDKLCAVSRAGALPVLQPGTSAAADDLWRLAEEMRIAKMRDMARLSTRFVRLLVQGMQDGSVRPLDQAIAALQVHGMINAAVELRRWVRDADADNAADLFVRPMMVGLLR